MVRRALIFTAAILALLWLGGLEVFVLAVHEWEEPNKSALETKTDAIVVLTGGSERVATGLNLLTAGKADKLFISGVHPGLSLDHLLGSQPVAKDLRDCCIFLGHSAESTFGNAEETQTWLDLEKLHSMRLVTANYHMQRSLMIFRAAMPDISIIPYPVTPDSVQLDGWWWHPGTASLLVTEYNKYLYAVLRLWLGT